MRLLFYLYSLTTGGAERVTVNLANHWAAKGWDVTIVTLAPLSLDFYELDPKVRRISLGLASKSRTVFDGLWINLRRVQALRRVLQQIRPDIAVALMSTANIILALASWGLPEVRAVGSERTFAPAFPLGIPWQMLRRNTYRRLAAVVALTQENAEWLRMHTSAKRVPIIPNMALWPLPAKAPRIAPETIRAADRRILLAVGRLLKNKGFDQLLEAFTSLAQKHGNWDLVILGEGPERGALESQVLATNLNGRVALPGRAGNMGEWYERADLYVLCSHFEGFPNTLVEAMAYGVPTISFDCDTGPRDIIRHAVDGLLVPPGDVAGLNAALDRLMGDSALRTRFAARAVESRKRFSIERIAGMWEELFTELREGR
jgi:glycosyltransferase involved in cell wall biosynthesis